MLKKIITYISGWTAKKEFPMENTSISVHKNSLFNWAITWGEFSDPVQARDATSYHCTATYCVTKFWLLDGHFSGPLFYIQKSSWHIIPSFKRLFLLAHNPEPYNHSPFSILFLLISCYFSLNFNLFYFFIKKFCENLQIKIIKLLKSLKKI